MTPGQCVWFILTCSGIYSPGPGLYSPDPRSFGLFEKQTVTGLHFRESSVRLFTSYLSGPGFDRMCWFYRRKIESLDSVKNFPYFTLWLMNLLIS